MHQFRVGSVSKPITAAAILTLVDQGRIQLDQKVGFFQEKMHTTLVELNLHQ
jgi:beta-lactamase class A